VRFWPEPRTCDKTAGRRGWFERDTLGNAQLTGAHVKKNGAPARGAGNLKDNCLYRGRRALQGVLAETESRGATFDTGAGESEGQSQGQKGDFPAPVLNQKSPDRNLTFKSSSSSSHARARRKIEPEGGRQPAARMTLETGLMDTRSRGTPAPASCDCVTIDAIRNTAVRESGRQHPTNSGSCRVVSEGGRVEKLVVEFTRRSVPAARLLAVEVVARGPEWALQSVQLAFWVAIGDADNALDAENDFDKLWASLQTSTASAEDSSQTGPRRGILSCGSAETLNVAQYALCLILGFATVCRHSVLHHRRGSAFRRNAATSDTAV
jgi:hypothetical protein